ncbi:hypothetical protein HK098_008102 [Nowakowskiella sp. JEL0407]|nr:hypothetical protein HK098_008102 [Nowakowskiella sp. JEL0407]
MAMAQIWRTSTSNAISLNKAIDQCVESLLSLNLKPTSILVGVAGYSNKKELFQIPENLQKLLSPHTIPLTGAIVSDLLIPVNSESRLNETCTFQRSAGLSISITTQSTPLSFFMPTESLQKEFKSVGRWPETGFQKQRGVRKSEQEWFEMSGFTSVSKGSKFGVDEFPEALRKLVKDKKENLFITFSDNESRSFHEGLDLHFEKSTKIGLIGTRTPFLTGTPYCLYHNNESHQSGVVGLAFPNDPASSNYSTTLSHPGLVILGSPLIITKCRGNVILGLDGSNAMRHLLKSINLRHKPDYVYGYDTIATSNVKNISPDKQMYARLFINGDQDMELCRVIGGNPMNGTLAIETNVDLAEGMKIQFAYHTEEFHHTSIPPKSRIEIGNARTDAVFAVTHPDAVPSALKPEDNQLNSSDISNSVALASDSGVVCGDSGKRSVVTDVPFTVATSYERPLNSAA